MRRPGFGPQRALNFCVAAALICGLSPNLRAASGSWTNDADGNWGTATNWAGSIIADGPGSTAYFTNTLTAARTVTLDAARTLGNVAIGKANGYLGNNLTVGGNQWLTLDNSGNPPAIACWPLLSGSSAATFSSPLTGTVGWVKQGTGTLVLANPTNRFTGGVTVSQGTLKVTGTNSLGLPATPANLISVSSGASFDFYGLSLNSSYPPASGYTVTIAGYGLNASNGAVFSSANAAANRGLPRLRLAADASIGNNSSSSFWIEGPISGACLLTKVGTSTVVIDGGATLGPEVLGLVVSNGTLTVTPALGAIPVQVYGPGKFSLYSASPRTYTNSLTLNDGSTFYKDNVSDTWNGPVTLNGRATVQVAGQGGSTLTVSGVISGAGALTKTGPNGLILSGANSYTGGTTVNAGTLKASSAGVLGSGDVTVASGAMLELDSAAAMNSDASLVVLGPTNLVYLNFSGTQSVNRLWIGATQCVAGTWGATGSGASNVSPAFSGTGLLKVAVGPVTQFFPQPRRSGIFYSTLFAKTGEYVRLQAFGTNAAQCFLADVNGDRLDDAVTYFTNAAQLGQWWVAWGNGQSFANPTLAVTFTNATAAMEPLLADINGDNRLDACLFDPAAGSWWVALSTGTNFAAPALYSTGNGVGSTDQFLADVDGDGKADAVLYFDSGGLAGKWYVGLSRGSSFGSFTPWLAAFGTNTTQRLLGDVNGDGKADAVSFAQSSGTWNVALSTGTNFVSSGTWLTNFGAAAPAGMLYDVDRDGRTDAVYSAPNTGDWRVCYSTGTNFDGSHTQLWVTGLGGGTSKQNYPAAQAKLLGSLSGTSSCACAVILGNWFALENSSRSATVDATVNDTWNAWGNNYIPQLPGLAGTYDSGDPVVNDLQARLIHDAGFDYIMFDDTNDRHAWVENRISSFIQRLRVWNQNRGVGQRPLYFCLSEGASRGKSNWQQIIENESKFVWDTWCSSNPDLYYQQGGKPLLIHFVWDPSYSSGFNSWSGDKTYSSRFTIRWMYNSVGSDASYANAYGWPIPGDNPVGDEVMDVMPGFWNGYTFTSRSTGAFYASQWQRVLQYQPASVWVNSWNETWEHTAVEPSWLHGQWVANPGISRWNDYYGARMDNFYQVMTAQYNWLFRNNVLVNGAFIRETGSPDVYRVSGSNFVYQGSMPHQAPVLLVPSGFRTNFQGAVVATNFTGSASPASRYLFDEPSGSVALDSLGGRDGQLCNGATRSFGGSGNALTCDGAGGYARLPQSLSDDFTISLWLRTTAAPNGASSWWQGQWVLADEASTATNGVGLTLVGGRLVFGVSTPSAAGGVTTVRSFSILNDGLWHCVVATRSAVTGELRLYVDGIFQAADFGPYGVLPASGFLRLGSGLETGTALAGSFDLAGFYDQVLSPATVSSLGTGTDIFPVFARAPFLTNGMFTAQCLGHPGQTYRVEYKQDLRATNWLLLTNVVAPGADLGFGLGGFQWQDTLDSSASRFYRVRPEAP